MKIKSQSTAIVNGVSHDLADQIRETRLLESRSIFMSEGVMPSTAQKIVSDLLILDSISKEPINLYVNSPGGEVNSGFSIYDTIRYIDAPVRIINTGLCASIATIINISVDKDQRFSMPNSKFLIHQPLISGVVQGQATDLEITANQIMQTREKLNKLLAEACGQKFEKIEEDTQRDYWMSAEEALEYGLIGKIITSKSEVK